MAGCGLVKSAKRPLVRPVPARECPFGRDGSDTVSRGTVVGIDRIHMSWKGIIGHIPVRKRIVFFSFLRYDMVYCYVKQEKRSGMV